MTYSLWETESGNVIGDFDSELAALLAVLDAANLNGSSYVQSFALAGYQYGKAKGLASGSDLLKLAQRRCHTMPA